MPNKSLNTISRQVENFIQRHHLIRRGQHVLVAVSGGADSVALLNILRELQGRLRLRLTVAHLNHKIRGKEADEDARFVKQLARRLHLDFMGGTAAVPRLARRSGISLEMAGRKARYIFFEKAAKKHNCDVVATAHTADDSVESILLMLVRGCGLQGLTGIAPMGKNGKITVIRPLLGIDRPTIENYLRARNIVWREDISNADPSFLRNRVRHELLPLLEAKYNRRISEALNRMSAVLREENDFIERIAEKAYAEACFKSLTGRKFKNGRDGSPEPSENWMPRRSIPTLNWPSLIKYHIAVRRRALRRWLLANGVDNETIDFQLINSIDGLLAKPGRSRAISLADGLRVNKNYQWLTIESVTEVVPEPTLAFRRRSSSYGGQVGHPSAGGDLKKSRDNRLRSPPGRGTRSAGWVQCRQKKAGSGYRTKIKIPGMTVLPVAGLQVKAKIGPGVCRARAVFGKFPVRASMSLKKLGRKRIFARPWRPGDRIRPYGLDGSKKIQDIFSDAKVPVAFRRRLPIFECGGEIVWIPGYRIAKEWEVNDITRNALQLTVAPS